MAEKINKQDELTTFDILSAVNVNEHIEIKETNKASLKYLSWSWAWAEVKKRFPQATYEVIKFNGLPYVYDEKTGYMVYTTVTIDGITHEMWLPVMDGNNRAMLDHPYEVKTKYNSFTVQPATMFEVNKTIMRCLTKNLAVFGLGLYIYNGVDLPETAEDENRAPAPKKTKTTKAETAEDAQTKARNAYQALIDYCKEKNHDIRAVAKDFSLNAKSSASDFELAMRKLIFADSKNADDMPEEV